MRTRVGIILGLCVCSLAAGARDYWVDVKSQETTEDGTETYPFKTIQAAIDAVNLDSSYAFATDTIWVRPGTYDQGGQAWTDANTTGEQYSRVYIGTKKIRLRATGSAADTFIVGEMDPTTKGIGSGAVSGIKIETTANGTIVRGFTIMNCASKKANVDIVGRGLAVMSKSTSNFIADCTVSNCVGYVMIASCTAIRCGFFYNYSDNTSGRGLISREANLLFCVGSGNRGVSGVAVSMGRVVGCTFADNQTQNIQSSHGIYNSVFENVGAASTLSAYSSGSLPQSNNVYVQGHHVVSPGTGDYRVAADSPAVDGGDASYVAGFVTSYSVPSELDPYTDYAGYTVPQTGTIHSGAIQAAATVKTGRVKLAQGGNSPVFGFIDGHRTYLPTTAAGTVYPTVWTLRIPDNGARRMYRYRLTELPTIDGSSTTSDDVIPETNGTMRLFAPAATGATVTVSPDMSDTTATNVYVSASAAAGGDGSKEHPFQTIAAALAVCTSYASVVHVGRGTYAEKNLSSAYGAALIADEGPSVTTLDATGGWAYHISSRAGLLSGFTVKNASAAEIFQGQNDSACIVVRDSLVTNCTATGSIFNRARVERTKVVGCTSGNYLFDAAVVKSSLVGGCTASTAVTKFDNSWTFFGTTVADCTSPYTMSPTLEAYNSILAGGAAQASTGLGNIVWDLTDETLLPATGFTKGDPKIFDAASGDPRIMSGSAAAGHCAIPTEDGELARACTLYYSSDLNGTDYDFTKATANAGCSQQEPIVGTRVRMTIDAQGGVDVTGLTPGTHLLSEETTITITRNYQSAHCCLGVRVNGVLQPFDANDVWTLTVAPGDASVDLSVEDYSTCWYVDANIVQQAGKTYDGMTWARAYRTLREAAENAKLVSGDTVWMAEGTYDDGVMDKTLTVDSVEYVSHSRLAVPAGVTFSGAGDRAKTFVVGAPDPTTKGLGDGAIRGVYLDANSKIANVTITNGYTHAQGNNLRGTGGGVWAVTTKGGTVEDCIVTRCHGWRGGGMEFGIARRTLFLKCTSSNGPGAGGALFNRVENCVFDGCSGNNVIDYPSGVINCTFLNSTCTILAGVVSSPGSYNAYNCYVDGPATASAMFKNCHFTASGTEALTNVSENCEFGVPKNQVDANYVPLKTSGLVDAGGTALYDSSVRGQTDFAGVPRILNDNKIDVGACEYDWRTDDAKALGKRVTVPTVDAAVKLEAGVVTVPAGASLTIRLKTRAAGGTASLATGGAGTPTVTCETAAVTGAAGVWTLPVAANATYDVVVTAADDAVTVADVAVPPSGTAVILK